MSDASTLDGEIADAEKRVAALEATCARAHPSTSEFQSANAALNLAEKRMSGLKERRAQVQAGLPDPATPKQNATALRFPGRVTKEVEQKEDSSTPWNVAHSAELDDLVQKYIEDSYQVARTEDCLREMVDAFTKEAGDTQRAFSQGLYVAFIGMFHQLKATVGALAEFNKNRRQEFDARLKVLEERPELRYLGVYRHDVEYREANAVTHKGSVWIAKCNSVGSVPNESHAVWQLAVKAGRDGR